MSTVTVSNPSPSGSWSPEGFSTSSVGRQEVTTPSSVGQVATPFGNSTDSQPRRDSSPGYFNLVSNPGALHFHFPVQGPMDPTPQIHSGFHDRSQKNLHHASPPKPDLSGYDCTKVMPAGWKGGSKATPAQTNDPGKLSGIAPHPFNTPAWPWRDDNNPAAQSERHRAFQKSNPQNSHSHDPSHPSPSHSTVPPMRGPNSSSPTPFAPGCFPPPMPVLKLPPAPGFRSIQRAETLPASLDNGKFKWITSEECRDFVTQDPTTTLIMDIRPFPSFSAIRIQESVNLCIPTTLLKRPSFNLERLKDTMPGVRQKEKFKTWRSCKRIIACDDTTESLRDASPLICVLRKFTNEGWDGEGYILKGGYSQFAEKFPDLLETPENTEPSANQPLSISLTLPGSLSISGGCSIPKPTPSLNPMYNSIRQNTELVDGVGQIPIKMPPRLAETDRNLPSWLETAVDARDNGKAVSAKFLQIERAEQARMQEALSEPATYDADDAAKVNQLSYRIAGIEKGTKNRYNNIYPYEHCRVKLGNVGQGACDYVNASYVKASRSNKLYIATQAPLPSTFKDFWNVIWEQDSRLIVMLTAESEGPQIKCHPYWRTATYGPLHIELVNEYKLPLNLQETAASSPNKRTHSRRESTAVCLGDEPYMTVRHLTLLHASHPFAPMREITQVQYSHWPDFGAPAQPAHLLRVIEETNKFANANNGRRLESVISEPEPPRMRKIVVHCSAGCGRTGTFCTVDSVIDMLKRQQLRAPGEEEWVYNDNVDLVASTVEDFRRQRLSMVQSLRQFVLCYEIILEWLAVQGEPESQ